MPNATDSVYRCVMEAHQPSRPRENCPSRSGLDEGLVLKGLQTNGKASYGAEIVNLAGLIRVFS